MPPRVKNEGGLEDKIGLWGSLSERQAPCQGPTPVTLGTSRLCRPSATPPAGPRPTATASSVREVWHVLALRLRLLSQPLELFRQVVSAVIEFQVDQEQIRSRLKGNAGTPGVFVHHHDDRRSQELNHVSL